MLLADKKVVITGGTGSLGKILTHRILSGELGKPKKVIIFSRDEAKQHEIRMSYIHKSVTTDEVIYRNFMSILEMRIGDVRDYASVCSVVKDADIVFNVASLKQVPTCEYFPMQAVMTNCIGAFNIARAIEENSYPVETVVGISTDKACKPVSVMGLTKSIQERILIAANIMHSKARFISVRYGNVLASRGSVIPLFQDQIKRGGPVTITVPEMTRFLISLNEAVDIIFAAVRQADPGDIYVPGAPSTTVLTLAQAMIGDRPIETVVTGIRPGEKMHEIMVSEDEVNRCYKAGNYYVIRPMLPELRRENDLPGPGLEKEFSSADVVLGLDDTVALLKKHKLIK